MLTCMAGIQNCLKSLPVMTHAKVFTTQNRQTAERVDVQSNTRHFTDPHVTHKDQRAAFTAM